MLPDDDKRYAIETCRSSESVLKSDFKITDIQSVHLLVVWYLVNLLWFETFHRWCIVMGRLNPDMQKCYNSANCWALLLYECDRGRCTVTMGLLQATVGEKGRWMELWIQRIDIRNCSFACLFCMGVKFGISRQRKNIAYFRIGCWGRHLVLRGTRWQETGECFVIRNFAISSSHQILLVWRNGWGM